MSQGDTRSKSASCMFQKCPAAFIDCHRSPQASKNKAWGMSANAYPQPVGRPSVREGRGGEVLAGLARQYRARGVVYAPAKFDRGMGGACHAGTHVVPTARRDNPQRQISSCLLMNSGGPDRDRTGDLLNAIQG